MMVRTLVVLTLSVLLVEYVAYQKSSEQIIALTEQRQLSLTALFAERFDRAIQRIANDLQTISDLPSLEEYYLNRHYELLTEADQQLTKVAAFLARVWRADPAYARLEVIDPNGVVVLAVVSGDAKLVPAAPLATNRFQARAGWPSSASPDPGDCAGETDALSDEGLQRLEGDGGKALVFSGPVHLQDACWGRVRTFYRLDALTAPLARERLARTGHLAVVADNGTVVHSPRQSGSGEDPLTPLLLGLQPGTHEVIAADGRRLLVSTSRMSSKNWTIAALVPRGELLAGLDATLRLVVILIIANVIVELLFIVLFARRIIINPIQSLLAGTRQVLDGNLNHRVPVLSGDEFGELAASFNAMTESLQQTVAELRGREQDLSRADELLRQKLELLEHEVAERARTATALSDQSELLRVLLSAIPAPVFYKDEEGVYLGCNAAFAEMLRLSEEEVIGKTAFDVAPEKSAAISVEGDARAKEGRTSISHEATVVGPDGSPRHYIVHKSVFRRLESASGESTTGIIGVMLDITQRRALEAQLLQSQKMEAVGVLASGIAHDFNNILQVIASYTRLLLGRSPSGDTGHRALLQIQRAGDRAADLIRDLMTFGRKKVSQLQQVDLNTVVRRSARLITRTIPKMIRVELDLAGRLEHLEADPSQLEQVLVNLATNARDAMPDGGLLRFATSRQVLDEEYCRRRPVLEPGPYAVITVADTGSGMDSATRSRIFEPFFTTKEVGMGTGLGLSSVYGIVRSHRGHIDCYSKPGAGTEFTLYLPISPTASSREQLAVSLPLPSGVQGELILVVDDDPGVLEASQTLLEGLGYRVLTATSGEEALEVWRTGDLQPDLTILDLGMPGMGGRTCLRRLLEIAPRARIIVATGYGTEEEEHAVKQAGARDFIAKPYQPEELNRKIRSVLDTPQEQERAAT